MESQTMNIEIKQIQTKCSTDKKEYKAKDKIVEEEKIEEHIKTSKLINQSKES